MDQNNIFPSVIERYYVKRYKTDVRDKVGEDQCILFHSNRICVIGIAKSHPIIREKKTILCIDFQVTEKVNRLNNKVSGKSKKGAQWLNEDSPLCKVLCSDDSLYTLSSCVRGKLVEVNDQLLESPQLLAEKPQENGYIAIVLPKFGESETQCKSLLTEDQYLNIFNSRTKIDSAESQTS